MNRATLILVAIYAATMLVLALWLPVWHDADWRFFSWVSAAHAPAFSPKVALVDVRSWDPANVPANRRTVARFLDRLATSGQHPDAAILDIEFGPCQTTPCTDRAWLDARAELERSLRELGRARIPVFAAEALVPGRAGRDEAAGIDPHDAEIYGLLTGAAQTHILAASASSGLFYRVCYEVPRTDASGAPVAGATEDVWAMVWRVMPDFDATQPCNAEHLPIAVGPPLAPGLAVTAASPFPAGTGVFDDKYVIVGTLEHDRPAESDRSGPELLAWALSDVLEGEGPRNPLRAHYEARPQNGMLALFVPAFGALVALAFTACFFALRRLPLRGVRRLLPVAAALAALAIGAVAFAGFELWMLAENWIQPQVTLIGLGMVVAAILCAVRGTQAIADEANAIDPATTETYDYDVFISYAHDEGAWVFEHVYVPFRDATLPDGKKLSVFFDTSSIRSGTAWQTKLALAIDGSRFVVPVYSDVYFTKPYCRFEILRAHRKWIAAGEESRCVLPVMRGHPKIYATVDDIQALSIDDVPDLVAQHVADVVRRLSHADVAAAPQSA